MSAVIMTASQSDIAPLPGRLIGAPAWLHWTDANGALLCGCTASHVLSTSDVSFVLGLVADGAIPCPLCVEARQ